MWRTIVPRLVLTLAAAFVATALLVPVAQAATTPALFGACTKDDGERVWRASDFPARIEAEYGEGFTPATEVFGVYKTFCRDLNGDGRREMIVLLAGPTVSSPTPWAIFESPSDGAPAI